MRCLIGVLLIWLGSVSAMGQAQRQVDSLRRVLAASPNQDTVRVKTLLKLSKQYLAAKQSRQAANAGQEGLRLAQRLRWRQGQAKASDILGDVYLYDADYQVAQHHYMQALALWKQLGDRRRTYLSAHSLALVLSHANELQAAIKAYQEVLLLVKEAQDTAMIVRVYCNLGTSLQKTDRQREAIRFYMQGIKLAELTHDAEMLGLLLSNLGEVYNALKQPQQALSYLFRAQSFVQKGTNLENKALVAGAISHSYLLLEQPLQALGHGLNAHRLAKESGQKYILADICDGLSKVYIALNDYQLAYRYARQNYDLKWQILDEERTRRVADIQARYEAQQQERDIQILTQRNQIQRLATRQQRTLRNVALGSSVLLLGLTGAVYYRYRSRQRLVRLLNAQNQEKVLLLKEVHHRVKNNLQIVLSLLSSQLKSLREPAAIEALRESRTRVQSMALVHQNLYQTNSLTSIPVRPYLTELVQAIARAYQSEAATVAVHLDLAEAQLSTGTVMPLGLIVNELVTNAFKYAYAASPRPPQLHVTLHPTGPPRTYQLLVADNGVGLPALELSQVRSLGLRLVVGLSRQLKATLAVERPSQGTRFSLVFSEPDEPGTAS